MVLVWGSVNFCITQLIQVFVDNFLFYFPDLQTEKDLNKDHGRDHQWQGEKEKGENYKDKDIIPHIHPSGENNTDATHCIHLPGENDIDTTLRLHLPGENDTDMTPCIHLPGKKNTDVTPRIHLPGENNTDVTPCIHLPGENNTDVTRRIHLLRTKGIDLGRTHAHPQEKYRSLLLLTEEKHHKIEDQQLQSKSLKLLPKTLV